jgi:NADPH:quinone reductase-like Zn-dependent oxidoreductase
LVSAISSSLFHNFGRILMKAIICTKYGPPEVLQLEDVEKPTPKNNELLIRIRATTVSTGDCEIRRAAFPTWLWFLARLGFGFKGPRKKILGQDFSGEIEAVGKDVGRFKEGDSVFGMTGFNLGAYAEYTCMPDGEILAIKPANMTHEEAATVPVGGLEALSYLGRANIQAGQKILIIGAGGSIGTLTIIMAKLGHEAKD